MNSPCEDINFTVSKSAAFVCLIGIVLDYDECRCFAFKAIKRSFQTYVMLLTIILKCIIR